MGLALDIAELVNQAINETVNEAAKKRKMTKKVCIGIAPEISSRPSDNGIPPGSRRSFCAKTSESFKPELFNFHIVEDGDDKYGSDKSREVFVIELFIGRGQWMLSDTPIPCDAFSHNHMDFRTCLVGEEIKFTLANRSSSAVKVSGYIMGLVWVE